MRKQNRSVLAVVSGAAMALTPALVLAGGEKQGTSQQEQQQYGTEEPKSLGPDSGAKGTGGGPAAKEQEKWGTKTMKLDEKLSFPLFNGCTYAANVKGSVKPVKGGKGIGGGPKVSGPSAGQGQQQGMQGQQQGMQGQQQGTQGQQQGTQGQPKDQQAQGPMVDPDLRIEASVACPTQATVKITENLTKTGPMSKDDLENAIERRAAILSEASGRRCLYMPDFALTSEKLTGVGVSYLCPIQQGTGTGGGPGTEQQGGQEGQQQQDQQQQDQQQQDQQQQDQQQEPGSPNIQPGPDQ